MLVLGVNLLFVRVREHRHSLESGRHNAFMDVGHVGAHLVLRYVYLISRCSRLPGRYVSMNDTVRRERAVDRLPASREN